MCGHLGRHLLWLLKLPSPEIPLRREASRPFQREVIGRNLVQITSLLQWQGGDLNPAPDLTLSPPLPTGPAAESSWKKLRVKVGKGEEGNES